MPISPNVSSALTSGADAPGAERPLTGDDSSIKVVLPTTTSTVVVTSATTTEGGFERSDYNGVIHKSEIPNTEEGFNDDDYEEEEKEEEEDSDSEEDDEEVAPGWRFKGKPRNEVMSNPPPTNNPRPPRGPQNGRPTNGTANGTATTQQTNGGQTGDRRGRT